MHFSFFTYFSDFVIFQVVKWMFLIFHDFQFSRHIPGPTVRISHFSRFSVILSFFKWSSGFFSFSMIFSFLAIFHVLQWTFLYHPTYSVFLAIFHVLLCELLIFLICQSSLHIPGTTIIFSFSSFVSFLDIFTFLQCAFLIYHLFE